MLVAITTNQRSLEFSSQASTLTQLFLRYIIISTWQVILPTSAYHSCFLYCFATKPSIATGFPKDNNLALFIPSPEQNTQFVYFGWAVFTFSADPFPFAFASLWLLKSSEACRLLTDSKTLSIRIPNKGSIYFCTKQCLSFALSPFSREKLVWTDLCSTKTLNFN